MISNIKPDTLEAIKELPCSEPLKKKITDCIGRYTPPEGLSGKVKYAAFRVWNAVKAIFGQSLWQKTLKGITEEITKYGKQEIEKQVSNPEQLPAEMKGMDCEKIKRRFFSYLPKISKNAAKHTLIEILYKNRDKDPGPALEKLEKQEERLKAEMMKKMQKEFPGVPLPQ